MRENIRKYISFMKHGYLDAEVYENIKDDINSANLEMLTRASCLGTLLGVILLFASFFVDTIAKNRLLYLAVICVMGALYGGCKWLAYSSYRKIILPLCYVFLTVAFIIGLVLGTFLLRDSTATTFCVLLFALPLLLIDRPFRMDLMIIISGGVFCICSSLLKPQDIASLDVVNGISFMFLSMFVNQAVINVKLRDLANTRLIEAERDTDTLTRLYSRNATETCIKQYMSTRRDLSALFVIDVDNFKGINDSLGHQLGDQALICVAKSLRSVFRHADIVGRFGGDEFIAFLPDVGSVKKTREKAECLQKKLQEIVEKADCGNITLSIGIAHFPQDALHYKDLFHMADEALYLSKEKGKNCFTIYGDNKLQARK
jgi:diguanylate cyclase (GGDEF)-like protein